MEEFAQLLAVSAVVTGLSHTLTKERIFAPLRERLGGMDTWLGYLVSCPYCASHYIAFVLVPLTNTYVIRVPHDWGLASDVLGWFLSSILVTFVAAFFRIAFYFVDEKQSLVRSEKELVRQEARREPSGPAPAHAVPPEGAPPRPVSAHSVSAHSVSAHSVSAGSVSAGSVSSAQPVAASVSAHGVSAHGVSPHGVSPREAPHFVPPHQAPADPRERRTESPSGPPTEPGPEPAPLPAPALHRYELEERRSGRHAGYVPPGNGSQHPDDLGDPRAPH